MCSTLYLHRLLCILPCLWPLKLPDSCGGYRPLCVCTAFRMSRLVYAPPSMCMLLPPLPPPQPTESPPYPPLPSPAPPTSPPYLPPLPPLPLPPTSAPKPPYPHLPLPYFPLHPSLPLPLQSPFTPLHQYRSHLTPSTLARCVAPSILQQKAGFASKLGFQTKMFTASVRNLDHLLELHHPLLSDMKADFDQKWDHRESAMQEHMEAQRRALPNVFSEERRRAHVINHSSSFAGLRGGSLSGSSGLEGTKSTMCPTLGCDERGVMVTVAEYKAWAFCARAWYETNSMAVPKKNFELLASICGKPAQVVAACVPIELALGADGIQKIGEVLDAYFGVDGCEGLLLAVCELIHGRRGHKPMLQYSMGVVEVFGRNQLQGVVIDQRLSDCVLLETGRILMSTKKPWCWLPRTVMCRFLLFKLLCGIALLTHMVQVLLVWSQIRVMGLA